jgi:hypothetical protein
VKNACRLISGGGSDSEIRIACNISQLLQFVNVSFPDRTAGYFPNEWRLISAGPSQRFRRIELQHASIRIYSMKSYGCPNFVRIFCEKTSKGEKI